MRVKQKQKSCLTNETAKSISKQLRHVQHWIFCSKNMLKAICNKQCTCHHNSLIFSGCEITCTLDIFTMQKVILLFNGYVFHLEMSICFSPLWICRFLGSDNKNTYFSNIQRHRVVWEILSTTGYGKKKRAEIGIERLLEEDVFKAAFPLHDVRA